ncbi:MAG TPA: M56 family metallopeptidase [Phycisphaerae bacterium]|nr:M56 family metallopeptidase [Phycisphaerae bacterium]
MSPLAETLNRFGAWLVENLWHMSVELAILAGVVVAVIWLLRIKSPPLRHAFWCLVLAKPVATFLVASPISLYWFLRPPVIEVAPPPAPPAAVRPATPPVARPMMRYDMPRRIAAGEVVQPESLWRQLTWQGGMGLAWLGIGLAFGVRLISGCAYVAFLRQTARQQRDGPLAELVGEVTQSIGLRRRVAVAVSDVAHGPVLAGVIKPVILLPRHISDQLSTHQVRLIVAHEVAHVRRFDNLFLLIQRLAEMFLFFHPTVWLCGWAMRREAESACDDAVLAVYGGSTQYADSLTRVAEMRDGLTRRLLVNTFAAAESNFSQRVRRILGGRPARTALAMSAVSVVALVIIGCLDLPRAADRKPVAQKEESPMSGKTNIKTSEELAATLRREDGKVWIDGVPAQQGKNSVLAAMTSILQAAGEDVTYEYLMGVSSRAFRLQFNWCPSAPHSACGFNTFEPAMKAMGWAWTNYPMCNIGKRTVTTAEIATARQAVERSIDSGLACTFGSEEAGVVVGYEPATQVVPGLLRRTDRPTPYHAPVKKYPWGVTVYRKRTEPAPSRRESILWSLMTAVTNAHTEKFDPGNYTSGFAAWERWIGELSGQKKVHWQADQDDPGKIVRIDQLDEGAYFSACLGNAWCYESLIDARQAAAKYLRSIVEEFSPEAGAHLTAAADHYEKVADTLKPTAKHARYPWQLKGQENWTEAMRQAQTAALKDALAFERQAVAEIQGALDAEDAVAAAD